MAKKKGVEMAQIALAWSCKRVTAPIVGTTKLENLVETIGESHSAQVSVPVFNEPLTAL